VHHLIDAGIELGEGQRADIVGQSEFVTAFGSERADEYRHVVASGCGVVGSVS